jgi:hypothetical protein
MPKWAETDALDVDYHICHSPVRAEGGTEDSTQIAAISVKLGDPGTDILQRLRQAHISSKDVKEDARECLISRWYAVYHSQRLKLCPSPAVLRQRLVFRVLVPGLGGGFRGELKYNHATGSRFCALQMLDVVIEGNKRAAMFFQKREKPFLIFQVFVLVVHDEVGYYINWYI